MTSMQVATEMASSAQPPTIAQPRAIAPNPLSGACIEPTPPRAANRQKGRPDGARRPAPHLLPYCAAVRPTTLPIVSFQLLTQLASLPQRLAQRLSTTSRMAVSRIFSSAAEGSTLTSLPGLPTVHSPVPVVQLSPIVSSSMMVFHQLSVCPFTAVSMNALVLSSSLPQLERLARVNDTVKPTGSLSTWVVTSCQPAL